MLAPPVVLSMVLGSLSLSPLQSSGGAESHIATATTKPDVVLITVDALRADRLGLYGYARAATPKLDALAAESLVFERAYASMPSTSFSIASLMMGRHAWALAQESTLDAYPTLADRFRSQNYQTVALYPPAVHFSATLAFDGIRARHFGFADVVCDSLPEDRDAIERTDVAIDFLDQHDGKPVFLWAHYFAPHEPYVHHRDLDPRDASALTESERYDGEVQWVDREIGRLLEYIKAKRPGAIVIVTADHGEEFAERGGAYHGTTLYDEQIRVPLLIRVPDLPARREPYPVSTADLPRMLDRVIPAGADNRLAVEPLATSRPVFAELGRVKAVMLGHDKAICDLWSGDCELYDLANDPGEKNNLARLQPRKLRNFRRLIVSWVAANPSGGRSSARTAKADELFRRSRRLDRSANAGLLSIVADRRLDVTTRTEAARLLARTSRLVERRQMRRVWPTENVGINRWLATALARVGDAQATAWLARMRPVEVSAEPELLVRRAVVLADRKDPLAASRIAEALATTADDELRCLLMISLGRVGSREAGSVLMSSYGDVRLRHCAADALAQIDDSTVAEFALARLQDEPYSHVRALLVKALARARLPDLRTHLERLQATEREPIVSAAVTTALMAIAKSTSVDL